VNEMLKLLGAGLKKYFRGEAYRPLNWRMIDAIETLKEIESNRSGGAGGERESAKGTKKIDQ
jgi:hypothetical protein